ncbi:MAG: acyl carrier protein [Bacteroidota bacterium]
MERTELLKFIKQAIANETGESVDSIDETQTFQSMGLDSLNSIVVLNEIEDKYKISLNSLSFWDYPTLGAFTDFLLKEHIS